MQMKIHSTELSRMLKAVVPCVDTKAIGLGQNIGIRMEGGQFSLSAGNSQMSAVASVPVMDDDSDLFFVDGGTFQKVCSMLSGEVEILRDGGSCIVKGAGRTRLAVLDGRAVEIAPVEGEGGVKSIVMKADDFARGWEKVGYAVGSDLSRMILTGVLMESDGAGKVRFVALDGFQLSMEEADCRGDALKAVIPGAFMKMLGGIASGGEIRLYVDGNNLTAVMDGFVFRTGLLVGDYVDYQMILPKECNTRCLVKVKSLRDALKSGAVVNSKQMLVKVHVGEKSLRVMSNSEQADYEADIDCLTEGPELDIAFNQKYLMNVVNAEDSEEIELRFINSVRPAIAKSREGEGLRLVLPVRVMP